MENLIFLFSLIIILKLISILERNLQPKNPESDSKNKVSDCDH
jgi:Na+-transporting methylmalonyl-CoA/oxaloacetate decarboxylase gamma subunit